MKFTKRLIALLLAVLMLPVWNPTAVSAVEVPKPGNAESGTIPARVNPLYAGIYTVDDFDRPELPQHTVGEIKPNATYVSMAQGITQMRTNLKNRAATFTIYVKSTSSNATNVANELFSGALVHTGNPKEGDYLQWQWATVEARYDRVWTGSEYCYTLDFGFTYYTTAAQEKKVDTAVSNLINSLGVRYKSDYEKIKGVYDWICANVTYDHENLNDEDYTLKFSAYAAIIDKTAVCQGYALLFYRMMLELGIDARFIAGIGGGGAHGWNIVELNDLYYNVDSTWDAGMSRYSYFLTNTVSFVDHYRYLDYASWEFHEEYPMAAENYASGATDEIDPYIYIYPCGDNAAFAVERDGTLTIAGTGSTWDYNGEDWSGSGAPWHYWEEHVEKLVVEDGITRLGSQSFRGMDALKSITLPGSLEEVGYMAFYVCEGLTSVKLPKGVKVIERYAFGSTNITKVTLPDTLEKIGDEAFRYCENLKAVTIPDSVTYIGSSAFGGCDSLTSIVIPESVTSLCRGAFESCGNLVSAEVRCKSLPLELFRDCNKLTDLVLYNTVTIGHGSLEYLDSLEELIIPATVTEIDDSAFYNDDNLHSIYFLGDAPTFDASAFDGCSADVYYPVGNETWTSDVMQDYSGNITWVPMMDIPEVEITNVASTGKIKLTWDKVEGAAKYKVYHATSKNGTYSLLKTITGTSLTHSSAVTGKQYYYYVVAVDSNGNASFKSEIVTRTCDLPRPAVTLTNVASTGKIKISWEPVEGAVEYKVYRSTDNKNWTLLKTTTGTKLTNTSAAFGNKYYYKVQAIASKSSANSAYSTVKSAYCVLPRTTVTLSNLSSSGKIKIKWSAVEDAVKYEVYRSTDKENWTLLKTTTGTSLNNTSAEAGTLYYYKVKAIAENTALNSADSAIVSRYCDLPRPTLTVTLNSNGKPYLTWDAVEDAVKYEVYRSTDNKTWTLLKTTTGTRLTNTSTTAGSTYYYKVKAIAANSGANSANSYVKSATCVLPNPVLTVTLNSSNKPYLTWTAVSGAVKYEVYRSVDGADWTLLKTTTGTKLTNTSVVPGMNYAYKVRAIAENPNGNSAYSVAVEIRTPVVLEIVRQPVSVTVAEGETLTIDFEAVGDGLSYQWYYKTADSAEFMVAEGLTGSAYTAQMTNALNGCQIYCVVTDQYGNSLQTETVTMTMKTALQITRQPASVTAAEGENLTIDFEAVGDGLSYQWYYKTADSAEFMAAEGFTGSAYTAQMTDALDGCQIYCVVTDQYGNTMVTDVVTISLVQEEQPEEKLTEEVVYERMMAMQSEYPEGMPWTNDNFYAWNGGVYGGGYGCVAFAFLLSDAAFGDLPARMIEENISIDMVRVGDILRVNGDTHSVIILEVHDDYIVIAEGNYNSSIHWGRTMTAEEVTEADYVLTRYPEA